MEMHRILRGRGLSVTAGRQSFRKAAGAAAWAAQPAWRTSLYILLGKNAPYVSGKAAKIR